MSWLLGKLALEDVAFVRAFHHPSASELIAATAAGIVVVALIGACAFITYRRAWRYLWLEWLTSLDAKKIGVMYVVIAFVMLTRALIEALLMRVQQAVAVDRAGIVSPEHFGQLFSTHGTIMIFFMAMPFLTGIFNVVVPLQIGARDLRFPLLNAISLWLTAAGAALLMVSLVVGEFSTGGWTGYPPFTERAFNPGVGPDYWIWAVTLSSLASTMTGVNFAVTIYKQRAPGMTWFRLPLFSWTVFCTSILMIFGMVPLTAATGLLALDRYADFHFFTNDLGGNMMLYANLFWLFGHPEVYILILPAFGVYSEVISTFSGKRLYGYRSLVFATMTIAVLSFGVWVHHFFTMGQTANLNAVFGVATMLIGVPTGVKVYDWLLTMVRGRIRFTTAMCFSIMFLVTFVIGGVSGVMLANPTIDFAVHNSLFLVAHFHNMLIPGLLFGMIAATQLWFPKMFGFRLEERWGQIAFWCWAIGFYLAFMPLYVLGLLGGMRRTHEWLLPEFAPWLGVALAGAVLMAAGLVSLFIQLGRSIRHRRALRVPAGDPWDGLSLEWSVPAPPPEYNFPVLPEIDARDAFWSLKRQGRAYRDPERYQDIVLPANSAVGPVVGVGSGVLAFALVWQIWWLATLGLIAVWVAIVAKSFRTDDTRTIPADTVRRTHQNWLREVAAMEAVDRRHECTTRNRGLATTAL